MAVVGSPSYFAERKRPKTPQDLTQHSASTSAYGPTAAASTRGSSKRTGASLTCARKDSLCSTAQGFGGSTQRASD
jgi:hypothetical protein